MFCRRLRFVRFCNFLNFLLYYVLYFLLFFWLSLTEGDFNFEFLIWRCSRFEFIMFFLLFLLPRYSWVNSIYLSIVFIAFIIFIYLIISRAVIRLTKFLKSFPLLLIFLHLCFTILLYHYYKDYQIATT